MTIRSARSTKIEQLGWFLIAVAFVRVEIAAIANDRTLNDQHQAAIRKEERQSFAAVLDQSQQQFLGTLSHFGSTDKIITTSSYWHELEVNRKLLESVRTLSLDIPRLAYIHISHQKSIYERYATHPGVPEDPIKRDAALQQEQVRYEREFAEKTRPRLLAVLKAVVARTGRPTDQSNASLGTQYHADTADAATMSIPMLQELAKRLVPQ
jgi:hypothetical protein